ncbi:MAG: glucosaminidase domain-containing protein [Gammaproteobacteria bacterium]|nr:glucosaminidase domain-containing protein [Gammaproteobacteria bacterium]
MKLLINPCKFFLIYLFVIAGFFINHPVFAKKISASQQQKFIHFMLPKVKLANNQVLMVRAQIKKLHQIYELNGKLSAPREHWVFKIARKYSINNFVITSERKWGMLLSRVDILPNSLVLAQAINESGWGKSYFAKEGNNYFGQWCTAKGCGIVPRKRPKGRTYEVKKFPNAEASVKSYLLNINTHRAYHYLRSIRKNLRITNQPMSGLLLVDGLSHYSQKKGKYVTLLEQIIKSYNLENYDAVY